MTLLTLLTLAALTRPAPCTACPCVVPVDSASRTAQVMVPQAASEAAAVFVGRVVRVDTLARDSTWFPSDTAVGRRRLLYPRVVRYVFEVARTWKGPLTPKLAVLDTRAFGSCRRAYTLGERYLVYAETYARDTLPAGTLSTYACSRVQRVADAADDFAVLGPDRSPQR